jgi:hypothetical protein
VFIAPLAINSLRRRVQFFSGRSFGFLKNCLQGHRNDHFLSLSLDWELAPKASRMSKLASGCMRAL